MALRGQKPPEGFDEGRFPRPRRSRQPDPQRLPPRRGGGGQKGARGRPVRAQRYRLSAPPLEIDIWLDDGDWVALESPAKGGRRLRYELL